MKAHYSEDADFIEGRWVNLSAWYWEDGTRVDEDDLCWICETPCQPDEHGSEGFAVHEQCQIDRLAMAADARHDIVSEMEAEIRAMEG